MDDLAGRIAAVHGLRGDPDALHAALLRTRLVVAMTDDDAMVAVADRGLRWVCAFTSPEALADFGAARGEGDRRWPFRTVDGAELLGQWIPEGAVGLAIDLAGACPMLFPTGALR